MGPTFNSIVIRTDKMDEMRKFYTALGMKFVVEKHGHDLPLHYSATLEDGKVIEIYPRNKETDKPTPPNGFGGLHIFDVDSIQNVVNALANQKVKHIITDPLMFEGRAYYKIRDPDNQLVMLVERKK